MQPSGAPTEEEVQEQREWFDDLNRSMISLDNEYKTHAVFYHCIKPDVRDEPATGAHQYSSASHKTIFEYTQGGNVPHYIQKIIELETLIRSARGLIQRAAPGDWARLRKLREEGFEQLDFLEDAIRFLEECHMPTVEWHDSTGASAIVPGDGMARFDAMEPRQRTRFLNWASQMREMLIARSIGQIKSERDMARLMLGQDERRVFEWPDRSRQGAQPVVQGGTQGGAHAGQASVTSGSGRRRQRDGEAEREVRASHGPGAAARFR